jgi:hypothetical protein
MSFPGDDEDLPPPYTNSDPSPDTRSGASIDTSIFALQLYSLRSRIASQQASQASAREQRDNQVLAILVPHVESILSSIGALQPPPALAEAKLVPEEAITSEWQLSDDTERAAGEIRRVVRVKAISKLDGQATSSSSKGGAPVPQQSNDDEWGWNGSAEQSTKPDPLLWWDDEGMAIRLARSLQPDRPAAPAASSSRTQQPAPAAQAKKSSRWKLFNGSSIGKQSNEPALPSAPRPTWSSSNELEPQMTVKAESVTFRRENEFGIWESKSGWGIVIKVRIPRV